MNSAETAQASLNAIQQRLGISQLTPIQTLTLEKWTDNDMIGLSPTGSGKTLAFSLATLPFMNAELYAPQVLVLCPTRELANQVAGEIRKAFQLLNNIHVVSLIGGEPMGHQIKSLKGACHVIVGTPGRVKEHIDKRRLDLSSLHTRILDEADRMLEMGMIDDVEAILDNTPQYCRTGLFSATYANHLESLTSKWLVEPAMLDVREQATQPDIKQHIYLAEGKQKDNGLAALLTEEQPSQCIVFVQTRKGTQQVFEFLADKGFAAITIHGELEQYQRERALAKFAMGAANILVATDVAARGLDLPAVDLVISYDLSESDDTHKHRIGRTGRAGKSGKAIMFVSQNEVERAKRLVDDPVTSKPQGVQHLRFHANRIAQSEYQAIEIRGGKKDKLRKGDIVGALIKEAEIPVDDLGTITLNATNTFLAVKKRRAKRTLQQFRERKIKGRRYIATKI